MREGPGNGQSAMRRPTTTDSSLPAQVATPAALGLSAPLRWEESNSCNGLSGPASAKSNLKCKPKDGTHTMPAQGAAIAPYDWFGAE